MVFSVSWMLYELGDIIDITHDDLLGGVYRKYFRSQNQDRLAFLFENFIKLTEEQLIRFKLQYMIGTKDKYAMICTRPADLTQAKYIVFKDHFSNPVRYVVG